MTEPTRPLPSLLQPDPNENHNTSTSPSAFRPQSSSSRRSVPNRQSQTHLRPLRHGHSSSSSIDSTALLDHRDQPQSISRSITIPHSTSHSHGRRSSHFFPRRPKPDGQYSSDEHSDHGHGQGQEEEDDEAMRLISSARQSFAPWTKPRRQSMDEGARLLGSTERLETYGSSSRPFTSGGGSPPRSAGRRLSPARGGGTKYDKRYSHVNHPSSIPSSFGSPPPRAKTFSLVGTGAFGEMLSIPLAQRAQRRLTQTMPSRNQAGGDVLIDIDKPRTGSPTDLSALPPISTSPGENSSAHSSTAASLHSRRKTYKAEEDVCFPTEEPSHKAPWPEYDVLEEWAAQEGKLLDEGSAASRDGQGGFLSREGHRKVSEPVMVDGRYRRAYAFPSAVMYEVSLLEVIANVSRTKHVRIDLRSLQINWRLQFIRRRFPS
jgi:magnesium transporter